MAIPLSKVARLEEFPRCRVERVAERRVVQYRGHILPLLDVDAATNPSRLAAEELPADTGALQVVVCTGPEQPIGLIVERILDIVEQDTDVLGPSARPAVAYTAIIQGRVTQMLDVDNLIRTAAEV